MSKDLYIMITFFGASVTQQKNGYAIKFREKIKYPVKVFGYGGMHLINAGICYLDDVLRCSPEYCFIDWFSTDYIQANQTTEDCLNTIIYKFSQIGCRLVFLFFPRSDHENRRGFYVFLKEFLTTRGLEYLDLSDYYPYSNDLVKDSVHTSELGSEKYADVIYEYFIKNKDNIIMPLNTPCTYLSNIKHISIRKKFHKYFILQGKCKIVTFEMQIGKYSGIVKLNNLEYNIWDIWCHYNRLCCKLDNISVDEELRVDILQKLFDVSECRRDGIDFGKISKKLIINRIFYTGDNLNLKDGK